jgi:hypothetical protein
MCSDRTPKELRNFYPEKDLYKDGKILKFSQSANPFPNDGKNRFSQLTNC